VQTHVDTRLMDDIEQTRMMAEQLRKEVAAGAVGDGQHTTMSFGVSASAEQTVFDYPTVFAQADAALYEAKRSGRDRVCAASPAAEPTQPCAPASVGQPQDHLSTRAPEALAASVTVELGGPAAHQSRLA